MVAVSLKKYFLFKQKTAYELPLSLVFSEMWIKDSPIGNHKQTHICSSHRLMA